MDGPEAPLAPRTEPASDEALEVLYQDEHVIAVAKPSGVLVHRTRLAPDRDVLDRRVKRATGVTAAAAHRLDRGASGVVLFGVSTEARRGLSAALQSPATRKLYLAIARGVTPEHMLIDRPLKRIKRRKDEEPRPARTELRRLGVVAERHSLCLLRLYTGRRHQIRRHLRHPGHPLLGDAAYGLPRINAYIREHYGLERLALHAWRIELLHPMTGAPLTIEAPLPPDLAGPLRRMPGYDPAALTAAW